MRTTLTIDDDVLDRAHALAAVNKAPFRRIVNEALRAGLQSVAAPVRTHPYRTRPRKMGVRDGINLDNVQELLTHIGGENLR